MNQDIQSGGGPAGALPFIYGHVDPSLFPIEQLQAAADLALAQQGQAALNYGAERGCSALLDYLQAKFARDEGLELAEEELMLTGGASVGLDAICRLFSRPGDTVLVEAPSYHEALAIIRDYPVRLAAVAVDEQGLVVEALAERLQRLLREGARPRLLYTIPTFQNPSGVTLSAGRRTALLAVARQHNLLLIEDDVYRDLAFESPPPPSLYSLAEGENVIRLGSFSKILAPGLRLGWTMAKPAHIARLSGSGLSTSGGGANPFAAFVTAAFCQQGWLEPHVARLVERYQTRRDRLLSALEQYMPEAVTWTRPGGGFFVWLSLPEPLEARSVLKEAQEAGVNFVPGAPFFAEGGGEGQARLPFSYIEPPDLERGIRILADVVRRMAN